MAFSVTDINGLGEYSEISKIVRFIYSRDLVLDLGWKSIVELMSEHVSPMDMCS